MSPKRLAVISKSAVDKCMPTASSPLEIVLDNDINDYSDDEDTNSQASYQKSNAADNESTGQEPWNRKSIKNSKSHRLIEKRRRDRMNHSLDELLNLIPHKKPENQRRIEKTEIIEMAVKYIRCLLSSSNQTSCEPLRFDKKTNSKFDIYRSGYYNGCCDVYNHLEKHTADSKCLIDVFHYIERRETELKEMTVLCDKQPDLKYPTTSVKRSARVISDNNDSVENKRSKSDDHCSQFAIDQPTTKVPIFVLHPSGTHYIPTHIDASTVANVLDKPHPIQPSIKPEQVQCHPISIPVNFSPPTSLSDRYELDIQNINVVGARHRHSVLPS